MGGIFSESIAVWGRGTSCALVRVAQNGTVGCEKVHSGGLLAKRLAKRGVLRKCLRRVGGDA